MCLDYHLEHSASREVLHFEILKPHKEVPVVFLFMNLSRLSQSFYLPSVEYILYSRYL